MDFPTALAIMYNDRSRCFEDSDRYAIHKIVNDKIAIWVEPIKEWRPLVNADVNTIMKFDYTEVDDPSIYMYTFTEAIELMKKGYTMKNAEYPTLEYTYVPTDTGDRFTTFNRTYTEKEEHTGFTKIEVESMWGVSA